MLECFSIGKELQSDIIRMRFGPAKIKDIPKYPCKECYLGQILCKFAQIIPNFVRIYTYMCIKYTLT